jgi:glyoxylase I family protein
MVFEHFALNVPDARAHARWYVDHLGFRVVREKPDSPFTHFLGDDTGRVIVELYSNPSAPILPFAQLLPLCFHVAVIAADARAERSRLETAGASFLLRGQFPGRDPSDHAARPVGRLPPTLPARPTSRLTSASPKGGWNDE